MPARKPKEGDVLLGVTRQMIPIMKYRERSTSRSVAISFLQPLHSLMLKVVILDTDKCMYIYIYVHVCVCDILNTCMSLRVNGYFPSNSPLT